MAPVSLCADKMQPENKKTKYTGNYQKSKVLFGNTKQAAHFVPPASMDGKKSNY